jgi:hypothetical protein
MLWQHAKESGMFMWMTDITALVSFNGPLHSSQNTPDITIASTIRSYRTKRVHQDGRKEPRRLQSVLYGPKEKGRARWALANGYMEQRAVNNAALTSEQLSGGKMEDSCFKECICIDGKTEVWYAFYGPPFVLF